MGFFEKKYCDLCGDKIGVLGNRKLADGNLCKKCSSKLSPWYEDRRHSTVDEIERHIQYREENKKKVREFRITSEIGGRNEHVFVDNIHKWFTIAVNVSEEENPDILDLNTVRGCKLDIQESREEEEYIDEFGDSTSYYPPRYRYKYDYYMIVDVDFTWFKRMEFKLNVFSINGEDRCEMIRMEDMGRKIMELLTGSPVFGQVTHKRNSE